MVSNTIWEIAIGTVTIAMVTVTVKDPSQISCSARGSERKQYKARKEGVSAEAHATCASPCHMLPCDMVTNCRLQLQHVHSYHNINGRLFTTVPNEMRIGCGKLEFSIGDGVFVHCTFYLCIVPLYIVLLYIVHALLVPLIWDSKTQN